MKNQEKIKTGTTDIEKSEGKENELDAITNVFLENAGSDDIHTREVYQKELQRFFEQATTEEREYAESLIRLKKIQYKDWIEQGFPMKEKKISGKKTEAPATFFSLSEHDIEMMGMLSDPDEFDEPTEQEIKKLEEYQKNYQAVAISDEQIGEVQKFINAHEKLPENRASEIQTLVSRAFPEFYLKQRPWKKKEKEEKKEEDMDLSQFKPEIDYAA